jgi:hypothetical protein
MRSCLKVHFESSSFGLEHEAKGYSHPQENFIHASSPPLPGAGSAGFLSSASKHNFATPFAFLAIYESFFRQNAIFDGTSVSQPSLKSAFVQRLNLGTIHYKAL